MTVSVARNTRLWYRIEVPPHSHVGIQIQSAPGEDLSQLSVWAKNSRTKPYYSWRGLRPHVPAFLPPTRTSWESFGFLGGERGEVYDVNLTGREGLVANVELTLTTKLTAWRDGPDCEASGFSHAACSSRDQLLAFPLPNPQDPLLLASQGGFFLDTISNYLWLRRDLLMLVRNAVQEVGNRFGSTAPLGISDITDRQGRTPGADIGSPRHPGNSHDGGGNMDIAYYQTVSDNRIRVICDSQGGSYSTEGFCLSTATSTHIVDLPRTAYFVAKLLRSEKVRVIGVDVVMLPLLRQAAKQLQEQGWLTPSETAACLTDRLYGGPGWPSHYHHMHISLQSP